MLVLETILPTGEPIIGRYIRLDLLAEADLDEMYPLLSDPEVYASGYVMHRRPTSLADARELARERFLAEPGVLLDQIKVGPPATEVAGRLSRVRGHDDQSKCLQDVLVNDRVG